MQRSGSGLACAALACGAVARRFAAGVPVAHGLCGRSGWGLALRRYGVRGTLAARGGFARAVCFDTAARAGGPRSALPRASRRSCPRWHARLRPKPQPTLPVDAFAFGRGACLGPSRASAACAPAKRCERRLHVRACARACVLVCVCACVRARARLARGSATRAGTATQAHPSPRRHHATLSSMTRRSAGQRIRNFASSPSARGAAGRGTRAEKSPR